MSEMEPLKEGQEVFLKRPVQIYAKVIGVREVDLGWPGGQVQYAVQLLPLEQSYPLDDLEIANRPQSVQAPAEVANSEQPVDHSPEKFPETSDEESPEKSPERSEEPVHIGEAAPIASVATGVSATAGVSSSDSFFDLAQEINTVIAGRAYELYLSRGSEDGHDTEDWLRAKSEILLNVPIEIADSETEITIRAHVPGFSEDQLEVRVAPRSVCITGKQDETPDKTGLDQMEQDSRVSSERPASQVFCVTDLPSEIDPANVDASLGDGVLEVKLQKVGQRKLVPVRAKAASA